MLIYLGFFLASLIGWGLLFRRIDAEAVLICLVIGPLLSVIFCIVGLTEMLGDFLGWIKKDETKQRD